MKVYVILFHIGVENVTMTMNGKVNMKNDSSPQSCQQLASDHSTPITKKPSTNMDAEESPDFDYSPSPILPLYTQEGGNEVAWDWQSSLSRTPENRNKRRNIQCETPKGTKLLQRKRNSNSPLLYKPFKRKTIKMENIENIGQFAAELQALNEKMRVIKQNEKSHSNNVKEEEAPTLMNTSSEEKTSEIKDKQDDTESSNDNARNSVGKTNQIDTSKKEGSGSYDDLFDDSVDDDMIRCTQEIEEKFNLMDKEGSTHSQVKKEESCMNDVFSKTSVQSSSSESCRKPLIRNILGASDNNTLKTYSKLSLRRDASSIVHTTVQRSKDQYKPCPNNNNTIHSHAKKSCDNKKLSKSNTVDLFDFPDDSFDDWLADCIEDEKLLSKSDGSLTRKDDSTKFQTNYKRLTNAPLKSEAKSTDSLQNPPVTKSQVPNASFLENRKFFKTKSLSDQYVNRDASTNAKGTTNASCYATRPMLQHLNSSKGPISRTSVARTLVSTKPIVINDRKVENTILLTHGTGQTRGSDVNRYAVKSDGDRFVKHHSTGNMKNDTLEMKTGSQPARCTAEEIERKRLQAVARLEAKRKLYMKITNNINR